MPVVRPVIHRCVADSTVIPCTLVTPPGLVAVTKGPASVGKPGWGRRSTFRILEDGVYSFLSDDLSLIDSRAWS